MATTSAVRRVRQSFTVNQAAKAKRVVINGEAWWVAPAVLINPGVLPGSKGPLMYEPDDCRNTCNAWDEIPITHYHPADPLTNEHLSANDPGVWERQGLGFVRRPAFNGRTRAELWFNERLTRDKAPPVMDALRNGVPMELSTGLYTHNEQAPDGSTFNGRQFTAYARNHQPDHLAVLHPDQVGACSLQDGCGVLVNKKASKSQLKDFVEDEQEGADTYAGLGYDEQAADERRHKAFFQKELAKNKLTLNDWSDADRMAAAAQECQTRNRQLVTNGDKDCEQPGGT